MKTKLFLIATLLISTIAFSQTTKKGYDYYKASSGAKKMNKGELIDAMAKDANNLRKRPGRTQGDPIPDIDLGRSQGDPIPGMDITVEQGYQDGDDLIVRKRPGRTKSIGNHANVNSENKLRKRPGRTKYKKSTGTNIFTPPIPTKATDYNSSRSNKNAKS